MEERVKIEIQDHIAIVSLNRPDKLNALDDQMFHAIIASAKELEENASIRVVILKGEGRAFCAGIDLSTFSFEGANDIDSNAIISRTHGVANKWQKVAWAWRELSVPVIAAVHGVCFGGGLQIMLGTDIKFVHPETKLSIMEMKWGIIPDMAGTQLMRHNIREDVIKELTYTHRVFFGEEAVKHGFASHVSENPFEDAMKLAKEIASKSPSAVVRAKKLINKAPYLQEAEGLQMESDEQDLLLKQHNQVEALFSQMQKREANFKDFRES